MKNEKENYVRIFENHDILNDMFEKYLQWFVLGNIVSPWQEYS
jgi:hypothetical protein